MVLQKTKIEFGISFRILDSGFWTGCFRDFYWRVSTGGGVLSRPERGQAVFED
jgi:hypothetical protein